MIQAGRRINDQMGRYVSEQILRLMISRRIPVVDSRVLILGLTFKENCPDLRNTRVVDLARELRALHVQVDIHDPLASAEEAEEEYGIELVDELRPGRYDAIICAVAHRQYVELGAEAIRALGKQHSIIYDVKSFLPHETVDGRL